MLVKCILSNCHFFTVGKEYNVYKAPKVGSKYLVDDTGSKLYITSTDNAKVWQVRGYNVWAEFREVEEC